MRQTTGMLGEIRQIMLDYIGHKIAGIFEKLPLNHLGNNLSNLSRKQERSAAYYLRDRIRRLQ